jgi:CHAT domain-containing protein
VRSGEPAAAALRSAMQEVRAEHPHPYHWAPFVLIGSH